MKEISKKIGLNPLSLLLQPVANSRDNKPINQIHFNLSSFLVNKLDNMNIFVSAISK